MRKKIFLSVLLCLFCFAANIQNGIGAEWVRPNPTDHAPAWGLKNGIRIGLNPESMRGLIHVYAPYLDRSEAEVINYIAIEPIVKGSSHRGFSELEMSGLDGVRGKRIWSADNISDQTLRPSWNVSKGVIGKVGETETLTIYFIVEPYENGAKVYLKARFYENRPYEVEFSTYSYNDSAELENCIVTATMGNYSRLRVLWLQKEKLHSQDVWPNYDGNGFALHEYVSIDRMITDRNENPYFIASPDENHPEKAAYADGTPEWWRYYGKTATQYWYSPTPAEDLNGIVNGRVVYWGDLLPIPGGISYENFEMKQKYRQGDKFVFGITPLSPKKFIKQVRNHYVPIQETDDAVIFFPDTEWKDASNFISNIEADKIGENIPELNCVRIRDNMLKVTVTYTLDSSVRQDDVRIRVHPAFHPSFHWAPHLTPTDNHVIDQHVFRNPAMIMQSGDTVLVMALSPENLFRSDNYHMYADMDAKDSEMSVGISRTEVTDHVLYERKPGMIVPEGKLSFEFYLMVSAAREIAENPFRDILDFFWNNYGHDAYLRTDFSTDLFDSYCARTYNWAFNTWKDAVWQEFNIDDKRVGAPVFIVDVTQSPNYPGEHFLREDCSIWNQAWFSSLRSAAGLYRYARRHDIDSLKQKALMAKELALSAPMKDGLFYAVVATPTLTENYSGHKVSISGGWENLYWGNSNRNPVTWDLEKSPFHILDMSWTTFVMLDWYANLEKDSRLLDYSFRYAEKLLSLQDADGWFPAWIDSYTLEILPYLEHSPESSMSAWFLLKLYSFTGDERYMIAAIKCLNAIRKDVIPSGRWEDFETYWSCCRYGSDTLPGNKVERNNMYKQCNFSMFWTAGALLEAYKLTSNKEFLKDGLRVLDEMLMTQASWQPPFIYVDAVGGFGVLNSDGEWNDARASLFAELLLEYGRITDKKEYFERGMMALKSAFLMMYCPENPKTSEMWKKTWKFFSEEDYGFLMENYGHAGTTSESGDGMGNFTIYDWGNGAASEAYNRIYDNWGKDIFENCPIK